MRKRGEMVGSTAIEVIIAIAGIGLLIFLATLLINPGYSKEGEIAKGYLEGVQRAVKDGGYVMLMDREEGALEFYLVYFGSAIDWRYFSDDDAFSSSKAGKNVICVCYREKKVNVCEFCEDLDKPARSVGGDEHGEQWVIGSDNRMKVFDGGANYVFSVE